MKSQRLTDAQYALYQKALRGIKAYTQEELRKLDEEDIRTIQFMHKKAQRELNLLKQKAITNFIAGNMLKLWKNLPYTSTLGILMRPVQDESFNVRNLSFSELGISRSTIIKTLITCGCLTPYFHNM